MLLQSNERRTSSIMDKLLLLCLILITIGLQSTSLETESQQSSFRRAGTIRASSSVQELAARGVLRRLLPSHLSSFEFKIVSEDVCGGRSCFWIQNSKSSANTAEITVQGTTAVDILSGLHWYLKYWCQAHVSWEKTGGAQLASIPNPGFLPRLEDRGVKIERQVPWSYYQNVVTSSYSFVWWNWTRWEQEIDWMALQGINLPLAFTGQETIWQKVFMDFKVTAQDLNDFFAGPAFLSWSRMGNLHGWGGPLSQHWLDQQLTLQKKIITRMVKLGMTPVLPSFSGNVPASLKRMYPSANITTLGDWNTVNGDPRWCCTHLLDPSDPLFVQIGKAFIRKQLKEYGDVTNIYNCDTFNENLPPTNDPSYISSLGAAVYRGMSSGNSDAIWVMQGWLFSSDSTFWKPSQMKALLRAVPFGKMIVLDLFADVKPVWKTSSHFYGTPYIWCMLHNFGGNIEMYGILDTVSSQPVDAHKSENSTMVGVGMCMEGIEQNPVVYELMSEMAFQKDIVPVHDWLRGYVRRRYGKEAEQVKVAWEILYRTIYNCTDGIADHNKDFIVMFPDWSPAFNPISKLHYAATPLGVLQRLSLKEDSYSPKSHLWYLSDEVVSALKLFLDAANNLSKSRTYRYDLVDLTRQVLSKLANDVYFNAIAAFQKGDEKLLTQHGRLFIQLIKDIDELLASNENFLLGTWLESAKNVANDDDEMRQYEWNARTQVTMWFDTTSTNQSKLHDYANKFWSGLLEDYYLPRASIYFSSMLKSLRMKKSFSLEEWRREWISFSNDWQRDTKLYPVNMRGDSIAISASLFHKYFG